jgi:hypothetical protein
MLSPWSLIGWAIIAVGLILLAVIVQASGFGYEYAGGTNRCYRTPEFNPLGQPRAHEPDLQTCEQRRVRVQLCRTKDPRPGGQREFACQLQSLVEVPPFYYAVALPCDQCDEAGFEGAACGTDTPEDRLRRGCDPRLSFGAACAAPGAAEYAATFAPDAAPLLPDLWRRFGCPDQSVPAEVAALLDGSAPGPFAFLADPATGAGLCYQGAGPYQTFGACRADPRWALVAQAGGAAGCVRRAAADAVYATQPACAAAAQRAAGRWVRTGRGVCEPEDPLVPSHFAGSDQPRFPTLAACSTA